jgi:hypothetical protein
LRIKSTVALVVGAGGAAGAGGGAVGAGVVAALEEVGGRRAVGAVAGALGPVGCVVVVPVIVVPVPVTTGAGATIALGMTDVSSLSLVLGGGGGMSRAGPLVGSNVGAPEASVVAALVSELDVVALAGLIGGPDSAAATSTPRTDITRSRPAHGSHAGSVRL